MKHRLLFLAIIMLVCGCGVKSQAPTMLSNFESAKVWDIAPEEGFILTLSNEYVTEGKRSLKVVFPVSSWPSINTKKLNRNWGEYSHFCFDVFNPQDGKINFVIRLDDNRHKKLNIDCPLQKGWNYVKIPRSRIAAKINADKISFVVLFLNKPTKNVTLYFDNMRLTREQTATLQPTTYNLTPAPAILHPTSLTDETFEPVAVKSPLPASGSIEAYVAKIRDPKQTRVLVSCGIPFAPGQLFSEKDVVILDINGNEMPIAVKVLAKWIYDNSIRSLLVQFPLEIEHKYKKIFLKWGVPRTTQDNQITEVSWKLPEGFIVLPAEWLCLSQTAGEQVPFGKHQFPRYDQNIEKYYPKLRDTPWTGDIRKDGYYDIAHTYYQLYVRSGNDDYFKSGRREAIHYRDEILKEGPQRGRHRTYSESRYIYVESMAEDYLLTGDEESLKVAGYMAEYFKKKFNPASAFFPKGATRFWTEREVAFPFLGIITYYELTGDKEYLKAAQEIMRNLYRTQTEWPNRGGFIHNLYSHDPEEGARPDEYGGSPFMTGLLLEAVIKYHQVTNSNMAKDSIFKALDWLINEGLAPDGKSVVYTTCDRNRDTGSPDLNLLVAHAFGYGYKISGYSRKNYLEIGKKVFEEGIANAYLKTRKHFSQNYRSSGHFLAYIREEAHSP